MALFQNTVIRKYLNTIDKESISEKWNIFVAHFHNQNIQENIRNSNEEQYQGEFLIDLFVNVLGYTKNPSPDFNLTTEYKNVKDSKKADGAIIIKNKVIAVIELKGTNTTDLNKIETQAFGYKNNQPECIYVITSNFEKLRFYIDNAIDYIEFNLFTLTKSEFELLYLCLAFPNIVNNIPLSIKKESVSQEDAITKKLYSDYSVFKRELFQNLIKLNQQYEPIELFKKSQKLLDRFLFLFFAEDRQLLPPNSVRLIVDDWVDLKERDAYIPLYNRFKKYFEYLNTGYKGKRYDVFAYNGGLFLPDEILDNVIIDDEILYKHTVKLADYDFVSEVDVNILGHIFEHSLNELEELKAELEGVAIDKSKTKRKKDGVFYTPKYITKYIVENTVGKLCKEKKEEMQIVDELYCNDKKLSQKERKQLHEKLIAYKNWLLKITICDPACGSGAFLNQALNFLIEEHRYIDELQAKLFGDAMVLSDVDMSILENNIYGVDINEESVEIAKLSLWLRTAKPNRKLNVLSNNIKCGNSLIDDPEVAGDKAFNWQKEFPQVFVKKEKKAWHVTFVIHNSRHSVDADGITKRYGGGSYSKAGFLGVHYAELTENEELIVVDELSNVAKELNLNIIAANICIDHVHALIVCEKEELSELVGKWKGKSSYYYNRRVNPSVESIDAQYADGTKCKLWAKSFNYKEIKDKNQLENTINYITTNRIKHNIDYPNDGFTRQEDSPPPTDGIICGNNSTISNTNRRINPSVDIASRLNEMTCTYEHAFRTEYKGGFDVVIGNPPYVRQELFKEIKPYLQKKYKCYNSVADLYTYFIEKGINLMNLKGMFSFILPNKFLKASYGKEIRCVIRKNVQIDLIFDFDDYPVFEEATTYPIIYLFSKKICANKKTFIYSEINKRDSTNDPIEKLKEKKINVLYNSIENDNWYFKDKKNDNLLAKIKTDSICLKNLVNDKIYRGVSTGKNEVFIISKEIADKLITENNKKFIREIVTGKEVKRYNLCFDNLYLLFIPWEYDLEFDKELKEYLIDNKEKLYNRPEVKEGRFNWWCLSRYGSKNAEFLFKPKIIYPRINNECNFFFDETGKYSLSDNNFFISTDEKYLISILNSKVIFYYLKSISSTLQGGYLDFRRPYIETIPIKIPKNKNLFILKTDLMLSLNKELQELSQKFQRSIQREFSLEDLPKKLQDWYELTYAEFLKELQKKKVSLSLQKKAEWEDYFQTESQKAKALKQQIDETDKEIDRMVYELYGLTEEEIRIVEGDRRNEKCSN